MPESIIQELKRTIFFWSENSLHNHHNLLNHRGKVWRKVNNREEYK